MADTGLLLRGGLFNTIYVDPPVTREIALAGAWLAAGTDNGMGGTNVHYLNLAALAKIGILEDDQGTGVVGFKTSDLPITFNSGLFEVNDDGAGGTDGIIINAGNTLYYAALGFKSVTPDKLIFTDDSELDLTYLTFVNYLPDVTFTAADITVSWNKGIGANIFNESTKTDLGRVTSSGVAYTFPVTPVTGDIISISQIDSTFNAAKKQTIVI